MKVEREGMTRERERRDHEKNEWREEESREKYLFEFDAILIAGFPAIGLDFRFDSFSPSNGESEEGKEEMREREDRKRLEKEKREWWAE